MDIRHKLNSYRPLIREINYLERKIEAMRDRQTSIRSSSDVSEVQASGGNSDKIGNSVAALNDLEDMYLRKIEKANAELREIETLIDTLEPVERLLMRARYIDGEYFEHICGIIGYSYRQTMRIHKCAIRKLQQQ
ncbi:MAG: hypothetical protein E7231_00370 [Cellulosilyticum sp.]|nr:hypothetical protein [Cellulosilyticum sp.]